MELGKLKEDILLIVFNFWFSECVNLRIFKGLVNENSLNKALVRRVENTFEINLIKSLTVCSVLGILT